MIKTVKAVVVAAGLAFALMYSATVAAAASGIQELGTPSNGSSLLSLGKEPEKKAITLNLGALRLGEAKLPPGPLTLAQRNQMRIRAAVQIEDAVSRARRDRLANRNAPAPTQPLDSQRPPQQEQRPAPGDIPDDETSESDSDEDDGGDNTDFAENDSDGGGPDEVLTDAETPVFE